MKFKIFDLGIADFDKTWQFQKEIFLKVKNGLIDSSIILCQHHPVITLGRLAKIEHILISRDELEARGIRVFNTERGGDVTYHGPGQLTVYPIFDLKYFKKDINNFLRRLEDVVIDLLSDFSIKAEKYLGLTGVWIRPAGGNTDKQKIASVGIAVRSWITFHGLSINIKNNDLDNFLAIKPCGMDIKMTSLETILGRDVEINDIKLKLLQKFSNLF